MCIKYLHLQQASLGWEKLYERRYETSYFTLWCPTSQPFYLGGDITVDEFVKLGFAWIVLANDQQTVRSIRYTDYFQNTGVCVWIQCHLLWPWSPSFSMTSLFLWNVFPNVFWYEQLPLHCIYLGRWKVVLAGGQVSRNMMEYVCIYSFTSKKRDQNEVGGEASTDEIVSHMRPPELENEIMTVELLSNLEKRPWNVERDSGSSVPLLSCHIQ